MMPDFLTLILALFALGFLVFIHELGHYLAARRVGMRVDTFSIGFGKPLFSWYRDGVHWKVGWLPFGGYVSIAGTQQEGDVDPYEIPDGFFGSTPWNRIKVALMGPVVNLVFAFLVFALIWGVGGREKNFSELTGRVGWVDPHSELFAKGLRPGDVIEEYNGHPVHASKDHFYAAMTSDKEIKVKGFHVIRETGEQQPFTYTVKTYQHPQITKAGILTAGVLQAANYVIYDKIQGQENELMEGSPLTDSGLVYGDRIFWVDGEIVVSLYQLGQIINDERSLATVERGGERFLARIPRVPLNDLKLTHVQKEEITDWQFESQLTNIPLDNLWVLPYNLTDDCVVEGRLAFLDEEDGALAFPVHAASTVQRPLQEGDRILAIDGQPVSQAYDLLKELQVREVHIIVDRGEDYSRPVSLKNGEAEFDHRVDWKDLTAITKTIGTGAPLMSSGDLHLLQKVRPLTQEGFPMSEEKKAEIKGRIKEHRTQLEAISDPAQRQQALTRFEEQRKTLYLGIPGVQDRRVIYNPLPTVAFYNVFSETARTLEALLSGYLNPKWMSGPVGIVSVIHQQSALGIREALFWVAFISLNLGMLNLLPIPVLDGGSICLSLFEMFTGRQLKIQTIEKLVIPFALLLIGLFVFLTYHDLMRLVEMFMR